MFVLLAAGLVIGGYFGWSKMHAGSHPAVVQEPSAVVRPAPSVMPPAPLPPEEQSASTPPKQVEVSESPAQQPEEVSVDPNPKPARAKPTPAIINTAPASKEPVPAKPQPIVVKNDFSRQTKWEAALPPAPAPLSIASAPNDQALTRCMCLIRLEKHSKSRKECRRASSSNAFSPSIPHKQGKCISKEQCSCSPASAKMEVSVESSRSAVMQSWDAPLSMPSANGSTNPTS